jgi:hypothetical protein
MQKLVVRSSYFACPKGTKMIVLMLSALGDKVTISLVSIGSEAAKYGLAPGDEITAVLVPAHRPSRYDRRHHCG